MRIRSGFMARTAQWLLLRRRSLLMVTISWLIRWGRLFRRGRSIASKCSMRGRIAMAPALSLINRTITRYTYDSTLSYPVSKMRRLAVVPGVRIIFFPGAMAGEAGLKRMFPLRPVTGRYPAEMAAGGPAGIAWFSMLRRQGCPPDVEDETGKRAAQLRKRAQVESSCSPCGLPSCRDRRPEPAGDDFVQICERE